ncbi:MAG TPA: endonuclease/exonuclease/phosphatase family protein [Anaerolineales bacterium]
MFATFGNDWRQHGAAWLLTLLVVVFGLQELRVLFVGFVGYLRDSVGLASLSLAPVAIGVFALSFLAGIINRLFGMRNTLWLLAGGLALLRVAEQLSRVPSLDLAFSIAATALFLMYIPLAVGMARSQGGQAATHLGLAFLLGVSLDSAIQVAGLTLDLSWQPGLLPLLLVGLLALVLHWALRSQAPSSPFASDGTWRSNLALLAIGPWLFLQLQVFQNIGLYSALSGWETPGIGAVLILGNALALFLAAQPAWIPRAWVNVVLMGVVVLVLLLLLNSATPLVAFWLLMGQVLCSILGMFMFLAATGEKGKQGLLRSTVMNGISQILFVLLFFLFYSSYDFQFGFRSSALPLTALAITVVLVALASADRADTQSKPNRIFTPALTAAALLLVPLALLLAWKPLVAVPAQAGAATVRVMDYNLHDAVNTSGAVDPEALAQIIEDSGADIVGLQEISRGWLIWGGMDMLTWLSQRLELPYIWDATADAQWGMAILSRFPIVSVERYDLPPEDIQLLRGFTLAQIDVDGTILTVINTHFSEKDDQDQIRNIQASAILSTWNHAPTTIIMGDFNALPDSQAIQLLLDAGLIDVSREVGQQPTYTYYSADPDHQIDYIFVTPDLGYGDFIIPSTTASDHLPLAVTIELP